MLMEQKHSNQHIKRKERAQGSEFIRKRIQAGILIKRLKRASAGKLDMSKAQLEATKLLLDKAMPSLQAVEHSQVEEGKTEEEIVAALAHLISTNPRILKPVIDAHPGVRAALRSMLDGVPSVVEPQQTASSDTQQASQAA